MKRLIVLSLLAIVLAGCREHDCDKLKDHPLIHAAAEGDNRRLRALIARGGQVNGRDADGYTALHWAADEGLSESVTVLLTAGANPQARTDFMEATPLLVARPHPDVIRALLEAGADPNATNIRGRTVLHHAMGYDFDWAVESVRLLLHAGASVNVADKQGGTPLMWAASSHHVEIVRMLLAVGADVNARDRKGETALAQMGPVRHRTGRWLPDTLDDLFNRKWEQDAETVQKMLRAAGSAE